MQIHNLGLAPQALCFRLLRRLSKANSTFSSNTRSNLPLLKTPQFTCPNGKPILWAGPSTRRLTIETWRGESDAQDFFD
jgi:hypothetical protein